jgi:hypothetical protein
MLETHPIHVNSHFRVQGSVTSKTLLLAVGWAAAAVIASGYLVYFANLRSIPFQDFPNHLARAVIMSDLLFHSQGVFHHTYDVSLTSSPYLLHDLVFASCIEVLGPRAGAVAFLILVFSSMPIALLFYMRAARLAPRAAPVVCLLGLYLATDSFFLLGFMGFRLALALLLVSWGCVQRLRMHWSFGWYAGYLGSLLVGYFTHLTATVFFAVTLSISTTVLIWTRASSLRREIWFLAPLYLLILLHVLVLAPAHSGLNPPAYDFYWGTWDKKLQYLTFEYSRFGTRLDQPMMFLLLAALAWPLSRYVQIERLRQSGVFEAVAVAIAFVALYFVLPQFYSDSAFVDVRALAPALIMVILACLNVPGAGSSGRAFNSWTAIALAASLALFNLCYLIRHVGQHERELAAYRSLGDEVPMGSYLLPIHTLAKDGELRPMLHAAGYLVADRNVITPYLFSGDRGDPMKYFRYRSRPYWPEEDWYAARKSWDRAIERSFMMGGRLYTWKFHYSSQNQHWVVQEPVPIDWNRVACRYDYLLMTKPVDRGLIEIPLSSVRENAFAVLGRVDKSACRAQSSTPQVVRLGSEH